MYYITIKAPQKWSQISLEEFLLGHDVPHIITNSNTDTITYERDHLSQAVKDKADPEKLLALLKTFNIATESLRMVPRESLYREFKIRKKSGGWRTIDAPNDMLKSALRMLKDMFENEFGVLYHTSAYAYIKSRSTMDAMEKHKNNESKWFAKYDFTNFFGSVTLDFTMDMLKKIFPFCLLEDVDGGFDELYKAVELGFLNGGLPQGTPLSPTLTNIIMIPIDFKINKYLRERNNAFCCTRYADDFQISSKYTFNFREIERLIVNTLKEFDAPMVLKPEKTRYGSSSGANWNLGLMLNRDNNITIGYRKKKAYQAALASFIMDYQNGHPWEIDEVRTLDGNRNYYRQIECDVIDRITEHVGKKFSCDPVALIKMALRGSI